ncbi:DUF805 domain-containing protein [Aurantiacibacter gangjinensis]|uniref:Uncharacterized protein n=1 Tax=Aurantiacibacter gangjinensis TaxID=502682 RepID=A0A0G9MRT2_9SPHN|nr:DUF805 domain-containing protein [Aurantiacibacter gangjinensis]APE26964.1 Integral membrane protein [Aurantiacibacter gangjinensis]KLE33415.1 hypothetical protein AAW01_05670 [Aurantiacibacter gangjinensis]
MLLPYKRYADFSGRSRRKEYWLFTLLAVIVYALSFMMIMAGMPTPQYSAYGAVPQEPTGIFYIGAALLGIFALASFIPALAVAVRRLHDTEKSGWFLLLNFIPLGGLILLIFFCMEGTKGANKYGADPKDPDNLAAFA